MHAAPRLSFARRLALSAGLWFTVALTADAADLTVSAAASLANALTELAPSFEAAHPGARLHHNFAASDVLVQQLEAGAPVDVLATADGAAMDRAAADRLIVPASRRDFVRNRLVVVVPRNSTLNLTTLRDLAAPAIERVALGAPASVPAGRYARAALEAAGLWPLPADKVVFGQSVRQALDYVARGEAAAGLVYATDAAARADTVRTVFEVPLGNPILYPVAVVAQAPQPALASAYVAWLLSPDTQAGLAKFGFGAP
ncbi:MAG: molybdate ABC transporter substrate-binding protein [Gammaproteobacteria bacterium]|nr:molybdate ABC transporter substrate-binding protein [Gammaproteobacteria bacterium]